MLYNLGVFFLKTTFFRASVCPSGIPRKCSDPVHHPSFSGASQAQLHTHPPHVCCSLGSEITSLNVLLQIINPRWDNRGNKRCLPRNAVQRFLSPSTSVSNSSGSQWLGWTHPQTPLQVPKSARNIPAAPSQSRYFSLPSFPCLWVLCATQTIWFYFRILSTFRNKSNEFSPSPAVIHPHCCSGAYYLIYIFKSFSKCRISGLESKTFGFFVLWPTQSASKVRYGVDVQQQTCLHGIWKPV